MPINPQIPTPPVAEWRGGLDINQILSDKLSAGVAAEKLASTVAAAKTTGNVASWDANGNLIDGGIAVAETVNAVTFNGAPTVLINGDPISYDDVILFNGENSQNSFNGA